MKATYTVLIFCFLFSCNRASLPIYNVSFSDVKYQVIAHSHNDYEQAVPIQTALKHGFTSLEVDVIYDGNDIRVSHDDHNLSKKPRFEEDYLVPILENRKLGSEGLFLLVDIKEFSSALLTDLNTILRKYNDQLVSRDLPLNMNNKVKILLSGDIPRADIIDESLNKYLFIDGRYTEYDLNTSSDLVPLISIDFTDIPLLDGLFNNDGTENERLRKTIELVHSSGKMVRFWNTKNKESVWLSLIEMNVDIVGVDDIEYFCQIMKKNGLLR